MIRTYKSGRVIEKSKFWVPAQARPRAGRVKNSTSAAKRDQNARRAVRTLARTINCNFGAKDLFVTATFDDGTLAQIGGDYAQLTRLLGNFMKRLKRKVRREGAELQWVACPSAMDGETGKPVRLHVHMVLSGNGIRWEDGQWMVGSETLGSIWAMGSLYAEPLRGQGDYTPVAVYMLRQARRDVPDAKKYSCSRNMKQPEITERVVHTGRALRQPARAYLLESSAYDAETGCHYIRYLAPEEKHDADERLRAGGLPVVRMEHGEADRLRGDRAGADDPDAIPGAKEKRTMVRALLRRVRLREMRGLPGADGAQRRDIAARGDLRGLPAYASGEKLPPPGGYNGQEGAVSAWHRPS